jgi:hypothetical protein
MVCCDDNWILYDTQKQAEVEQILELMNQQNALLMKRLNDLSAECKEIKKELKLTKAAT